MTAKTETKTLEELVVDAKRSGLSDKEIGEKFNVSFTFIQKAVTRMTGVNLSTLDRKKMTKSFSPRNFILERSAVWSFKSRGNWATHTGDYRGNWSPYIPRNIILRYSKENETTLDCFCGSGATAVECKLLNRNFIGIDINPYAINLANENIKFDIPRPLFREATDSVIDLHVGDARNLSFIKDNSIDLICTHPPYADIIQYTDNTRQDLSFLKIDDFLVDMAQVARENHRVLKDGRYCAILIGDMRKKKNVIPLAFRLIDVYLQNGFVLKELVIKRQHNCRTTGFWYKNSIKYNFLLLAHEYLAVFQKSSSHQVLPISVQNEPANVGEPRIEKNKLETTTVWITKPKDWFTHTINNLVSRYDGADYAIVNSARKLKQNVEHRLVIWDARDSPLVHANDADLVARHVLGNGYLALLCEDIRLEDGTIFPTAIRAEKELSTVENLKIREIVVVSVESGPPADCKEHLAIQHKYLLIYQKLENS